MIFTSVAPSRRKNCRTRNRRTHKTVGLDQFFNDFFGNDLFKGIDHARNVAHRYNSTNIVETEHAFEVEVALPGFEKTEVKVGVDKDLLNIMAERQNEASEENKTERKYIRKGFSNTNYKRSFHIPEQVEKVGIKAKYENGVLTVMLPKVAPSPEVDTSQTIEIG
ncbi:MAG: Hsp20/alpha crystallin family protein [Chitinophagales bacterium]